MTMRYDFGQESDVAYVYAAQYLDYLGTDSLTAEQIKQQFYKLACSYNIQVGQRNTNVTLTGLSENMPQALALLEHLMKHAQADSAAYQQFVALEAKSRADRKLDQGTNFNMLVQYGLYGPYNPARNDLSLQQLMETSPQDLLDRLKNLSQYEHTIVYYGPMTEKELCDAVTASHNVSEAPLTPPAAKHYVLQPTPENEVLIAPYEAKNIYMRMIHNENRQWNPDEAAVMALFNEYYGGGMNTIVFQEMREARGLAYNAYAYYSSPQYTDQPEYFFTHIITQNDKMMDCIRHFNLILDSIPQSEASFQIAKDALTKRLASQRTTKFGLINAWLTASDRGLDFDLNQRIYEALPALTLQDIISFEQQQMARKPYRYVILGDEKELDLSSLLKYGNIRRVSTEEIFGY
jgi:predicted Zn-dependent peptidase